MSKDATDNGGEKPKKAKTRWSEWEIAYLLGEAAEGISNAEIGRGLRRPVAGVRRMLLRLTGGKIECRGPNKALLEKVRQRLPATPKPAACRRADTQTTEQYKTLVRLTEAVRDMVAELRAMLAYRLALDVVNGCVTFPEIVHLCPGIVIEAARDLLPRIREYRKRNPELFNKASGGNGNGGAT